MKKGRWSQAAFALTVGPVRLLHAEPPRRERTLTIEVTMPERSLDARVVAWLKQPGDPVGIGEALCLLAVG